MAANGIAAKDYPGLQAYFEQRVIELVRAGLLLAQAAVVLAACWSR